MRKSSGLSFVAVIAFISLFLFIGCGKSEDEDGARLSGIVITPQESVIRTGSVQEYRATAEYEDGSSADISDKVKWSSSDESIASMEGNVATGRLYGVVAITARKDGIEATARLKVASGTTIEELSIVPVDGYLYPPVAEEGKRNMAIVGMQRHFRAVALFDDDSIADITNRLIWMSSDYDVMEPIGPGVFKVLKEGNVSITANDHTSMKSLEVEAVDAHCDIYLPYGDIGIPVKSTLRYRARGIFHLGDEYLGEGDIEDAIGWSSENPEVLYFDGSLAYANGVGKSVIRGKFDNDTVSSTVTVEDAIVKELKIYTADGESEQTLPAGVNIKLKAYLLYEDRDYAYDIADAVQWHSSSPDTAVVEDGLLKSLEAGEAEIYAIYDGLKSQVLRIEVLPKEESRLETVKIPSQESLRVGESGSYIAKCIYSDGSTYLMQKGLYWRSSDPRIAYIDEDGNILALKEGSVEISAEKDGVPSNISSFTVRME